MKTFILVLTDDRDGEIVAENPDVLHLDFEQVRGHEVFEVGVRYEDAPNRGGWSKSVARVDLTGSPDYANHFDKAVFAVKAYLELFDLSGDLDVYEYLPDAPIISMKIRAGCVLACERGS